MAFFIWWFLRLFWIFTPSVSLPLWEASQNTVDNEVDKVDKLHTWLQKIFFCYRNKLGKYAYIRLLLCLQICILKFGEKNGMGVRRLFRGQILIYFFFMMYKRKTKWKATTNINFLSWITSIRGWVHPLRTPFRSHLSLNCFVIVISNKIKSAYANMRGKFHLNNGTKQLGWQL